MGLTVTAATADSAAALAELAAATFPLACPPSATAEDIAAHLAENLSAARFAAYLADPDRRVLAAAEAGRLVGYAMLIHQPGPESTVDESTVDESTVDASTADESTVELSKMYVLASHHSRGAATALMTAGLDWARTTGAPTVWLGVNQANERAQRFYRKHGFEITGTRTFRLGAGLESDFVMTRRL